MPSSTRSISLVLLGSALFLTGCKQRNEDEDPNAPAGSSHYYGGRYIPYIHTGGGGFRGGGVSAPSSGVGSSARGGFGGFGAHRRQANMERYTTQPRADWPQRVESQGFLFHSIDDEPYWDESAFYLFEAKEVEAIESASDTLNTLCLQAVEHVVANRLFPYFNIPEPFDRWVAWSWEHDERTVYGRFDFSFDGSGPPKLLEYNADTPTALLEAAVIQWTWFQDRLKLASSVDRPQFDQFNSIHERLIEAWKAVRLAHGDVVHFSSISGSLEDEMTTHYLRDTATQAGMTTEYLPMNAIGWHAGRRTFTDLRERPIRLMFKLYPWEWMIREPFGQNLPGAPTRWLEPPWKMILSNKAILPILWELFPDHPNLLRAEFEPFGDTYVVKPTLSREGANLTIVEDGQIIAETSGHYVEGPRIYQDFHPLPDFEGRYPVIGSWMVNGYACGIGIREDDGLITRNTSRFVPHLFRKRPGIAPPGV